MKTLLTVIVLSLLTTTAFAGNSKSCKAVKAPTIEVAGDRR